VVVRLAGSRIRHLGAYGEKSRVRVQWVTIMIIPGIPSNRLEDP
jgi:hypothetical protein